MTRTIRRSAPLLLAVLLTGCAVSHSAITGQKRAYAYSWQQEIEMGREYDREIVEEFGLYEDPALTAYVTRVGEEVLSRSHLRRPEAAAELRNTPFTFRVLDTPMVNAFALPGGYVYVTRGLLAHMDSEAQLAVVLGHEVGHVAARHTSQRMLRTNLATVGLLAASLLGEKLYGAGDEVMGLGGVGVHLILFRNSRGDEEESDRLGVEYAARAEYRAAEGAGFFEVLNRMRPRGGWFPTFLSTHPDPGKREEAVVRLAGEWESKGVAQRRVEQDALYAAIDGMVLGANPRRGFVEDGVYHHPDGRFRLALAPGWEVQHENGRVQMVDPSKTAGILFRPQPGHTSARAAAADFVRENQLRVLREGAGGWGRSAAYEVEAEHGAASDTTRLHLRFVEHEGAVYAFAGMAPMEKYAQHEHTLRGVMESFGRLTDPAALAIQPARLRIVTASRSAPFRSLVPATLPRGMDAEDLALLNHLRVAAMVPPGRKLKLTQ
ncbi:MAG: M48 family metalloprotease [Gemmatimonadetes bacterium]|nr:M48 family metalloprotease [Gemmatimonadota bacterium]